jgi:hypothetical protein
MQLQHFIDVEAFSTEVQGELTDLTAAMQTQTARTAYYGMQHAAAKKQSAKVDLISKSVEAQLSKKYRTEFEQVARDEVAGTNKAPTRVTAEMVKSAVHLDPNFIKYAQLLIDAEEIETVCRVAYDAFKTRRDMLISLGQLSRAQLAGNATVAGAVEAANRHRDRLANRGRPQPTSDQASVA